jgi:hypothetical protein
MSQQWHGPWPPVPDPRDPLVSGTYEGWWRRSFALLKAGWRPMAVVQVIVTVPTVALTVPAYLSFEERQREAQETLQAGGSLDFAQFSAGYPMLMLALAVSGLSYTMGQLVTARLVVDIATGRNAGSGAAALAALRRFPALLGWSLLALPMIVAAIVLCLLPVLYVGAVLTVLPVVVLLERGAGIGRCFRLFHADLGVAIGRIATILGLTVAGSVIVTLLTTAVTLTAGGGLESPNALATTAEALLQGVFYVAAGLVGTPLLVTAYADMRARREPFSTAHLQQQPS